MSRKCAKPRSVAVDVCGRDGLAGAGVGGAGLCTAEGLASGAFVRPCTALHGSGSARGPPQSTPPARPQRPPAAPPGPVQPIPVHTAHRIPIYGRRYGPPRLRCPPSARSSNAAADSAPTAPPPVPLIRQDDDRTTHTRLDDSPARRCLASPACPVPVPVPGSPTLLGAARPLSPCHHVEGGRASSSLLAPAGRHCTLEASARVPSVAHTPFAVPPQETLRRCSVSPCLSCPFPAAFARFRSSYLDPSRYIRTTRQHVSLYMALHFSS